VTQTAKLLVTPTEFSVAVVWGSYEKVTAEAHIEIANPVVGTTYYLYAYKSSDIIEDAGYVPNGYSGTLYVNYRYASEIGPGTYPTEIRIEACYDQACTRMLEGSPAIVTVTLDVPPIPGTVPAPEPDVAQFTPSSRVTLAHDVVDAEYSAPLNAVVMVSSRPTAALHIYDLATSSERSIDLASAPRALGIGPDGVHAVVGHAAALTYLDLRNVGVAGAAPPAVYGLSAPVSDVVMAGNDYAYALPAAGASTYRVRSVNVATGVETIGADDVPSDMRARISPDGAYLAAASHEEIHTFSILDDVTQRIAVHQNAGGHPCGNLVFNQLGSLLYTGCGMVLQPKPGQPGDFTYVNRFLFTDRSEYYLIRAISMAEDTATGELTFVTEALEGCDNTVKPNGCWTHLETFAAGEYAIGSVLSLSPITIAGEDYMQRGLFVFKPAGTAGVLISRAPASPNGDREVYLSRF